jgi:hypothetical protein
MTTTPDQVSPMFDITRRKGPAPAAGGCCADTADAADAAAQGSGGCCGSPEPDGGGCCGG